MHKQGDIVLIPVPFTDLSTNKRRPVLILSNNDYNSKTNDVVVVAITSNIIAKNYTVFITGKDLLEGSLKVDSCIRVDKIYTLSKNIIIKKFGTVNQIIMEDVKEKLNNIIEN